MMSFSFDLEDHLTSYYVSGYSNPAVGHSYNIRGELLDEGNVAQGFMYPFDEWQCGYDYNGSSYCITVGTLFDPRMNANLGQEEIPENTLSDNPGGRCQSPLLCQGVVDAQSVYDSAGRNRFPLSIDLSGNEPGESLNTFDIENHTIGTGNSGGSAFYAYGPNGHPIFVGGGQTIHWDGDQPLFLTTNNSSIWEIFLPGIGTTVPGDPSYGGYPGYTGFTVWDRDPSGQVVGSHNATGSGAWFSHAFYPQRQFYFDGEQGGPVAYTNCGGYVKQASTNFRMPNSFWPHGGYNTCLYAPSGAFFDQRGEGLSDGIGNIQGVRNFSPDIMQWTSPDAYAGEVGDPTSQQPYMWDRNNPVEYSDPSGYMACPGNPYFQIACALQELGEDLLSGFSGAGSGTSGAVAKAVGSVGGSVTGRTITRNAIVGRLGESLTSTIAGRLGAQEVARVTFRTADGKITAVLDHVLIKDGQIIMVETKTGNAELTENQDAIISALQEGTAVPVGQNAANAGLNVGQPMGGPVIVVRWTFGGAGSCEATLTSIVPCTYPQR